MEKVKDLNSLSVFLKNIQEHNEKLEEKIKLLEEQADFHNWEWMKHIEIKKDDYRKELPCPRIEMNISNSEYQSSIIIGIVYPEYGNDETHTLIPMYGSTYSSILNIEKEKLPHNSAFHIYSYGRIFNLRMFQTINCDNFIREIFTKDEYLNNLKCYEDRNCRI